MSQFICAVANDGSGAPSAFALAEKLPAASGARYVIRDLAPLGSDALRDLQDRLAADRQLAGQVVLVTDGGRKGAAAVHDTVGISAVPVHIIAGESAGADALNVSPAELVDTFEGLYRAGDVEFRNEDDTVSHALSALYVHGDADGGALEDDRFDDEEIPTAEDVDGPQSAVEQSGGATALSTVAVGDATASAVESAMDGGRPGARADRGFVDIDLGEHRASALALALATWYGEWNEEEVPLTDQAAATSRRKQVRAAARARTRGGHR